MFIIYSISLSSHTKFLFYVYFMLTVAPGGNNLATICYKDFLGLATINMYYYYYYYYYYCNSTVWTVSYVVAFYAEKLWKEYNMGYGILSIQGKESKHSAIKQELKTCSNRSCSQDNKGKWHQLLRGSFVRNFYLPYHFPMENYVSRSDSRNPPVNGIVCSCF